MLAQAGGKVIIADVQADKGEALARELGTSARFAKCDVTSEADAQATVAAATALGPLRGLVNCAGIAIGEKTVGKEGPHALASFARVVGINKEKISSVEQLTQLLQLDTGGWRLSVERGGKVFNLAIQG